MCLIALRSAPKKHPNKALFKRRLEGEAVSRLWKRSAAGRARAEHGRSYPIMNTLGVAIGLSNGKRPRMTFPTDS